MRHFRSVCRFAYIASIFSACISISAKAQLTYNILDYGAKGDSATINTTAIQNAIDDCAKTGGTVLVPKGNFFSGSVLLKSDVTLNVADSATLWGSTDTLDYKKPAGYSRSDIGLIVSANAYNIGITGQGVINGNGWHPNFQKGDNASGRPYIIYFANCTKVSVSDITLRDGASWTQHYFACDSVVIQREKVHSFVNFNNDGIDIDGQNVTVSDCRIESGDDALCLKSDTTIPCKNVVAVNCTLSSYCNLIKFGTSSVGGFKNCNISNCPILFPPTPTTSLDSMVSKGRLGGEAGISLELVDGGVMDSITVEHINMTGIMTPIFVKLGARTKPGILQNIFINGVVAIPIADTYTTSSITGMEGYYASNITLKNIAIQCPGGGTSKDSAIIVPENDTGYPQSTMYGQTLPAYGFFIRHVKNLTLDSIHINLQNPDKRPAFVYIDTIGIQTENIDLTNNEPISGLSSQVRPPHQDPVGLSVSNTTGLTRVTYTLPTGRIAYSVTLHLFDLQGKTLMTLRSTETAGPHSFVIGKFGTMLRNGVLIAQLLVDGKQVCRALSIFP